MSFGQELLDSLREAVAHAEGNAPALTTHQIAVPDVRAIRDALHLSQRAFADTYGIPLATLKGWEQGRRQPDATASAYLNVIARAPDVAREALRAA